MTALVVSPTRDVVRITLFAALTAALGLLPPIPVPVMPVPITAQTLGVMIAGAVLGPRAGALAMILFLACVALGFPLLAGGRGGLGVFAAPGAGFLFGWPFGAAVTGLLISRARTPAFFPLTIACAGGGIVAVYAFGITWMAIVGKIGFGPALAASLVFIPGDLIKAVIAAKVVQSIQRGYPSGPP